MELLIYFIISKIKNRTKEYEYNSSPHIKLAVILWLAGELLGFVIASHLVHNWVIVYLIATSCGAAGGFYVYYKVMKLPKRNMDYFDLRNSDA
jgi:hypothetical protein